MVALFCAALLSYSGSLTPEDRAHAVRSAEVAGNLGNDDASTLARCTRHCVPRKGSRTRYGHDRTGHPT
jgi:hypothetical protein